MTAKVGTSRSGGIFGLYLVATALALSACSTHHAAQPVSSTPIAEPLRDRLSAALDDKLQSHFGGDQPGITVAITRGDQLFLTRSYGLANWEHDIPWTSQTRYTFYSVTKPMVAAAIIELERQGKLSLDQPITDFLTEAPAAWSSISIDDLLRHRSGLFQDERLMLLVGTGSAEDPIPVDDLYEIVLRQETPNPAPGSYFSYSDTAMRLAARIAARVHGSSFEQAMHDLVFAKAGMQSSRIAGTEPLREKGRASSYLLHESGKDRNGLTTYRVAGSPVESTGDGGAVGTVEDLAAFLIHLSVQRSDGDSLIDELVRPLPGNPDVAQSGYRRSMALQQHHGIEYYAHGGYLGKRIGFVPSADIGIAFMTNDNDGPGTREIMGWMIDAAIESGLVDEGEIMPPLELSPQESGLLSGLFVEPQSGVLVSFGDNGSGAIFDAAFQLERQSDAVFRTGRYDQTEAEFRPTNDGYVAMRQADWDGFRPLTRAETSPGNSPLGNFEGVFIAPDFGSIYYLRDCASSVVFQIGSGIPSTHRLVFRPIAPRILATITDDGPSEDMEGPYTLTGLETSTRQVDRIELTHNTIRSLRLDRVPDVALPVSVAPCHASLG